MKEINIAKTIIKKRKEKGITQDELANYIGVSKASVSKWETGQSYPDIVFLPQLAAYFNISIDELMNYTPQMNKENISMLYQKLSNDFSKKPFDEVIDEIRAIIKKYFSCYPLLLQMVILISNHYTLAKGSDMQITVLKEALFLSRKIKEESDDFHLNKQANSIEATLNLLMNQPNEAIDLLDVTMQPFNQDEMVLASAYEMIGDILSSKKTLQITSYQYVLYLIGAAIKLLPLYMNERERFEEILRRNLLIADIFNLETLHTNAFIQFYVTAACCLTMLGDYDRAIDFLKKGIGSYKNFKFPIMLHGDDYFDLLGDWIQGFELSGNIPRNEKLIRDSLVEAITNPILSPLFNIPEYMNIVDSIKNY